MIAIPCRNVIAGKRAFGIIFLLSVCLSAGLKAQTLQLIGEPVYPANQARQIYSLLAEYISSNINREISLTTPVNFQQHWLTIRQGSTPDIVIDQAPLTDFWVRYKGYIPLVRESQNTGYALVTMNPEYQDYNDLFMRPIATMPSPGTDYLVLIQWFENPLWQPSIISSSSSWADSIQKLSEGTVAAAVVPNGLVDSDSEFRVIQTSNDMPGLTISAAPWVERSLREELQRVLLFLNDNTGNRAILEGLNIEAFEPAEALDYEGYAEWLRTVSVYDFPELIQPQPETEEQPEQQIDAGDLQDDPQAAVQG